MSDLLAIGASGVRAYQTALGTVSENIANASTAGFSRRTTDLKEIAIAGGVGLQRVLTDGQGVAVTGVSRAGDVFRVADVRVASSDLSRTETGVTWLGRIETALTGNKLADQLTNFFNTAKAAAADPTASAPRAVMLEAAGSVANAFAGTGAALARADSDLDATANTAVTSLDRLGAALARVNDGISRSGQGTNAAAQLADQRDQIIDEMSAISDVSVSTDALGRATVRLGGAGGPVFVSTAESAQVTFSRGNDGTVAFNVVDNGHVSALSPSGGVFTGIIDGAARISAARTSLDRLATGFVSAVNANQAQGRDLDGNAGAPIFAVGSSPTDISRAMDDPRGIAAASVGGGVRDNANLKALETVRTSGDYEGGLTAMVTGNAATLEARGQIADAQSAIRDGAITARDAVSGVNIDSEAVDLMRFQQAYQASARVIQVARETLQSILDIR